MAITSGNWGSTKASRRSASLKAELDKIIKNFNKEVSQIEGDVQAGLITAGAIIKAQSQDNTPVDTGNLRASHYLVSGRSVEEPNGGNFRTTGKKGKPNPSGERVASEHSGSVQAAGARAKAKGYPFIELGCTAFYAEAVHEDLSAQHPSGKAKFMEDAIKANVGKALEIIKQKAKR